MAIGIGIGLSPSFGGGGGGGPVTIPAPFSRVNGPLDGPTAGPYEGWSVYSASAITDDTAYTVSRQGYNTSGGVTTHTDTFYVTRQIRQVYPNQASLQADYFANSDYIYSTDTPSGSVTNNSTFTSPVPICAWLTPHRSVVGDTIGGAVVPVEVYADHRNARNGSPVAAVVFSVTDGTTTITCPAVSALTVSNRTGDRAAVLAYRMPETTISTLNNNAVITIRAQVYPWIGASGSVADSNTGTAGSGRDFGPRYFYRATGLNTSPYYAYVKTGGTAGGIFDTNPVTAEATPFGSVTQAFEAINTGAAGKADGVILRLGNDGGTPWVLTGPTTSRNQDAAAIIITRDPNVARANARCSFGAAEFRPRLATGLDSPLTTGCLQFRDVQIVRTGTGAIRGEVAAFLEVQFNDVDLDNGSNAASWLSSAHDYHYGVTFTNLTGNGPLGSTTGEHRILRGISIDINFGNIEGWWMFGSRITRSGILGRGARTFDGAMICFNRFDSPITTSAMFSPGDSQDVTGCAFTQNLVEYTSATTREVLRISGDSATGNNTHVIVRNNTFAGAFECGRWNVFYDEGPTPRTSRLHSVTGNLAVAIYTKGDVFATSGTRLGNWAFLYGVGCFDNWSQYASASAIGGAQAQAYPGRGSDLGTSNTSPQMANSNFTDYEGTTVAAGPTYTAGVAPPGTYTLTSGSAPVADNVTNILSLAFDFAGTARALPSTNGAYEAP